MRKLILLFVTLSLAGCASQEAAQRREQARMAMELARATCMRVAESPALDPIRGRVALGEEKATVAQMADTGKPTAAQKAVIARIDEISQPCDTAASSFYATYIPALGPVNDELNQSLKQAWARLLVGEFTFGQFNSERAQLKSAAESKVRNIMDNQAAQQAQLQLQQQQLNLQRAQYFNALQQSMTPKRTNCYTYGNNVQCTQY